MHLWTQQVLLINAVFLQSRKLCQFALEFCFIFPCSSLVADLQSEELTCLVYASHVYFAESLTEV